MVQHRNQGLERERANLWWTARLTIDQLGAMFSSDHSPMTFDEWAHPPTPVEVKEDKLAKKRELLNAMERGLKFGIQAPGIDELRQEIERDEP